MIVSQHIGHAPRAQALSSQVAGLAGCVGCTDCKGLCTALMDVLTLPDLIARRKA